MGAFKLELRFPQRVDGTAVDPDPDWNFDALSSELNSLETKLNTAANGPSLFLKARPGDFSNGKISNTSHMPFVMRVSEDEMEDSESEDEEERSSFAVKRFNCDELYLSISDNSDNDLDLEFESYLMDETGSVEGTLCELTHEHQLDVKEEVRSKIYALEADLMGQTEKSTSSLSQVEKYRESRWEMDRKLDSKYQRKIAEALDNHLTAVQRDHELRSQIEERKIRSDAAYEEAKRKEKALQEEKLRQEKAKAKAETEVRFRAETAKKAALEAERREAKEATEREAVKTSTSMATGVVQEEAAGGQVDTNSGTLKEAKQFVSDGPKELQSKSNVLRVAESALNLEQGRLQKFKEIEEENKALRLTSSKDFTSYERHIARVIRQIGGTEDIIREKSLEILEILNDRGCPKSISIEVFAKKVVSSYETAVKDVFACCQVIVRITSQVPYAMDVLLAELHRACIYTVPKHIMYLKSAFESKEAYFKALGYKERNGEIESTGDYLVRLESYMRLYGALIQTEVKGVQNIHGLKEGWAWIARILNNLPANQYTAVALKAFLEVAGFALFRKYKSQFMKMLDVIYYDFLGALKARKERGLASIIVPIQSYIEDKKFLEQPEGREAVQYSLESFKMVPGTVQQNGTVQQDSYYG